jgi:hypothetical protein
MLRFDGQPLAHHYATVLAHHLGFPRYAGQVYEPPEKMHPQKGKLYVPAVYAFETNVKVFSWQSRFDLYFTDEPLSGKGEVLARMAGFPWPEDDLLAICHRVQDLPYGGQATAALIAQADWLDAHPEYRGLPKIADRHLGPREEPRLKRGERPEGRPRDWA